MAVQKPKTESRPAMVEAGYKTTGINVPADVWALLNRVVFERAREHGGRPSVSALLVDLVPQYRKQLAEELAAVSR